MGKPTRPEARGPGKKDLRADYSCSDDCAWGHEQWGTYLKTSKGSGEESGGMLPADGIRPTVLFGGNPCQCSVVCYGLDEEGGPNCPGDGELRGLFTTIVQIRGLEYEALKVVIRSESLAKTYSIQKKLDQVLVQQEDALNALQCQIDNGDALENESRVVRGRIGALWSRLDTYVRKDFRQRLHCEGDRSGCLLAWLLRCECPTPIILSLRGPTGDSILGQTCMNAHLREHLEAIYSSPWCDVSSQTREYLDGLQLPRLTDAQAVELEAELSLEDLQGALETSETPVAPPITQYYMAQFLNDIKQETGSLKADFKTCIQDLCRDVVEVGTRVDGLQHTMDSRTEDQEMQMRCVITLEDQ
ncbi:hypothetical protein NDU88_003927 [Pleurodeles waltl]|uniref:Uncharacterized protein n=1 Tax=Pleurodeles waltl TaxID=8319 RepID=A0AAV7M4T4_PLEWA|nr:hypothetical protein NDU88_003927 [Pleurodeles waltl]